MLFPFEYSSCGYAETEPNSIALLTTPPSVKYSVTARVVASTFLTDSEIVGATCSAFKVQTARSALASTRAEPVTVIPSLLLEAKPEPT